MIKKYNFSKGNWCADDFDYVYSARWKTRKEIVQEADCISNDYDDGKMHYISLLSKQKYKTGTRLFAKCNFNSFGAPLIVISNDISRNENGELSYGVHFEVVAWYKGLNIWRVQPYPERVENPIFSTRIASAEFPVVNEEICDIEVLVENNELIVSMNGHKITVFHEDIPENFHAGITACEGVNRFYEFTIED